MCQTRRNHAISSLEGRVDAIRAWKDEDYRLSLSDADRAALPANPAGLVALDDGDLDAVVGGLVTVACSCTCHCR
jgi:mersacidin/lichenicidin family type 2 lantibiotic